MTILDLHARLNRTAEHMREAQPELTLQIDAARQALQSARAGNGGLSFPSGAVVNQDGCTCVRASDGDTCIHMLGWRIWTGGHA
jgi:hypothetical protein